MAGRPAIDGASMKRRRWRACKEWCANCGHGNIELINPEVAIRLDTRLHVWLDPHVQAKCMKCGEEYLFYPTTGKISLRCEEKYNVRPEKVPVDRTSDQFLRSHGLSWAKAALHTYDRPDTIQSGDTELAEKEPE